jgi:hypothetical protein
MYLHRNSGGYPGKVMPLLGVVSRWIREGKIEKSVAQVTGWLIVLGAFEHKTIKTIPTQAQDIEDPQDLCVGVYEPATRIYDETDFLYIINIYSGRIDIKEVIYKKDSLGNDTRVFIDLKK